MNKSVGIITFHASHNFGSMLQAFSLQQVVEGMNRTCEIINFRTKRQRELYPRYFHKSASHVKNVIKYIVNLPFKEAIDTKYQAFEDFIANDLVVTTTEFSTLDELNREEFRYHSVICGSDQIWNLGCTDFDWAYYLSFINGSKQIAYAPSAGPVHNRELTKKEMSMIRNLLTKFTSLSCREEGTRDFIHRICGESPPIVLDPTLLLDKKFWDSKIDSNPIVQGNYIFVYTPVYSSEVYEIAKRLSKYLKIKVVAAVIHRTGPMMLHPSIERKIAIGPWQFLNLCKHAKLVCGKSFHLASFSTLLNVPFFSVNAENDFRVINLFKIARLEDRSISIYNVESKITKAFNVDFDEATKALERERKFSFEYLRKALDVQ